MENPAVADQIVLLKVRDMCCTPHLKQLKKEISKLDGVISVYVDPKKAVMVVTCKADANSALDTIVKSGKFEEVVRYYRNPNNNHAETENTCGGRYKAQGGGERNHRCEVYIPPPPGYYSTNQYPRRSHNFHDSMPRNSGYPESRQPSYGRRPFGSPSSWFGFSGFRSMPGSNLYGGQRGWGMM